jgi:hypothetical protein
MGRTANRGPRISLQSRKYYPDTKVCRPDWQSGRKRPDGKSGHLDEVPCRGNRQPLARLADAFGNQVECQPGKQKEGARVRLRKSFRKTPHCDPAENDECILINERLGSDASNGYDYPDSRTHFVLRYECKFLFGMSL